MEHPEETGRSVGRRLRALRELADGISQNEVTELAGLSKGMAWRLEELRRPQVTAETVHKFARVFGCQDCWLSSGEGPTPTQAQVRSAVAAARATRSDGKAA